MAKFAKLFKLDNNEQILLTYNYNIEKDKFEVSIITPINDCITGMTLGFISQENAFDFIENYSHEQAVKFRSRMEKLFT